MKAIRFIALLLLSFTLLTACDKKQVEKPVQMKVMRGDFKQVITESGELVTADTKTFVMPRFGRYWSSFKIIGMLDHGTEVQAGDSIVQFDPSAVKQFIVDRETALENEMAQLNNLLVNNEIEAKRLDAQKKQQEADFNMRKLRMASAEFETEKNRYISQLQFKQAEINYEKAKRNIEYAKVVAANNEKIQRIRVAQAESMVKMAYDVLPKLTIRTPISGIFQVASTRRGRGPMLKVGDEVRVGNSYGSVPDMTWMKVKTTINEVDRSKVYVGMPVIVRMDAMPELTFSAKVEKIGLLCRQYSNKDYRKVFDVTVKIDSSDLRLKPGMTASCQMIAKDLHDVLYIPNECLWREGKQYFVRVSNLLGQEDLAVKVVGRNSSHSVVEGDGLRQGQTLVPVELKQTEDAD